MLNVESVLEEIIRLNINDKLKVYEFLEDQKYGFKNQRIKRGRHKEGIYHIQHVNAFHNNLGQWMDRFRGVSTKYLSNYIYWFKWLCYFNAEKDAEIRKHLFIHSHTVHADAK